MPPADIINSFTNKQTNSSVSYRTAQQVAVSEGAGGVAEDADAHGDVSFPKE